MQGDRLYSELFNELYQFNLESRRWFPLAIRPTPAKKGAKAEAGGEGPAAAGGGGDGGDAQAAGGGEQQAPAGVERQQAAAVAGGDGGQQQGDGLPPGVSPEMHAMLQKMLADKGSVLHGAAAKIQANFRGYRVRQVGGRPRVCVPTAAWRGVACTQHLLAKPLWRQQSQ